jgi:hypothetical protein
MWPLFFVPFLSADFRTSQSFVSGAALQLMHAMQVGWLGDENDYWAEIRFGSFQVQGTCISLFRAPRSMAGGFGWSGENLRSGNDRAHSPLLHSV